MAAPDISLDAFKRYLSGVKSATTTRKYTEYAEQFLRLMRDNGYASFESLPPGLLAEYLSLQRRSGRSVSTVRVQNFAVRKYLAWVHNQGVKTVVQPKVDLPKPEFRQRPTMPADMFAEFFRQADLLLNDPYRTAAMLLPCCGLRVQELVTLKLDNIHKATVKLRKGSKPTLFLQVIGKGGRQRNVPLMEEGVEILTGYLSGWRKRRKGVWLFPSDKEGKHGISDRSVRGAIQKLHKPLGMAMSPHTMRRTYITMLWRKGVDLGTIAKIAGHANIQTTLNHYIIMDPMDSIQALHNAGNSLTD